MIQIHQLPLWAYFERDHELGGVWVAHVLELDLVTQGETLAEAIEMAHDAAAMIVIDDLNSGRNPHERAAPPEDFEKLSKLLRSAAAQQLTSVVQSEKSFSVVGTQIVINLHVDVEEEDRRLAPEPPVAWPITDLCA